MSRKVQYKKPNSPELPALDKSHLSLPPLTNTLTFTTPIQPPKMPPTPILLLKTKSSPQDGYEDFFSAKNYNPTFIPVLEHRFLKNNLTQVRDLFHKNAFNNTQTPRKYGGLIFTSQRAVEGFAQMIEDEKDGIYNLPQTPTYQLSTSH